MKGEIMKRLVYFLVAVVALSAAAQLPRWNLATLHPSAQGNLTVYRNFAAEEWRPFSAHAYDTPARGPEWPLFCDMDGTARGLIVLYWRSPVAGGPERFCNAAGNAWRQPRRWAYARLAEDVWDPTKKQHVLPEGSPAVSVPAKLDLDYTMARLVSDGYTKKQVMDSMDKFVWADGTGAPE